MIPLRFDTLLFGVIAAVIVRGHRGVYARLTSRVALRLAVAGLLTVSGLFAFYYYQGTIDSAYWLQTIGLTVIGFIVMVIVLCAHRYPVCPPQYNFLRRPVLLVSSISYSLYLVHLFVFQVMAKIPLFRPVVYVAAIAVSMVVAWLSFTIFEKRVLGVRDAVHARWFKANATRQLITAEIEKQP